ncbi:MAG: hypothetical protein A2806_03510 [Candidatus Terrybacteria bacterium RIFCSPHIGHO2_01_FULL_48_17]|uniref:Response regulatory domain-containing protein n=1 Tax=Candidatus Terrybacteria bacterium RIFCSPHIGHO2_01_FULL_48_17 TaxID=1802362 RepID=A0A1G2PH36_9BACT|nr:MAG: hypothetical protein A2806_03510 [Candidatus Terrybacteria bacterium RIFCSPHIGHO2_01_FULL_48_17]OHA53108.1 MAG: hypothetical protein A3A30_01950 [Candidatus Terrybacteria bacterium RIFCSPLOWO2_01_FULL_48_14]
MPEQKILIVEDEDLIAQSLIMRLEKEGYEALRAENGFEGLRAAIKNKPDLILLDILMPQMDGLAMLKKLREHDWGKNARVVLLTNLDDVENIAQAAEYGVADYLVKSDWELDDVVQKIKDKLAS